jgi:hypothetical protein
LNVASLEIVPEWFETDTFHLLCDIINGSLISFCAKRAWIRDTTWPNPGRIIFLHIEIFFRREIFIEISAK